MNCINGKVLIWTDHHFGVKGNSQSRQKICVDAMNAVIDYASKNGVAAAIFMGDYFHQRSQLSVDTINIAMDCLRRLSKICPVKMIVGNHDMFNKNSADVNSLNVFRDTGNVEIVDAAEELTINGRLCALVPWAADVSSLNAGSYDFVFGHFDVSTKYLVKSYVEANGGARGAGETTLRKLGISSKTSDAEGPGTFIDLAKPGGTVFAGHIHQRRETVVKGRNFVFVGSPYQQTMGDIGCECGFYSLDDGGYSFVEIKGTPKHMRLRISEIMSAGAGNFDFSPVRNAIVQKVYDMEPSAADDREINRRISAACPYEELLPEYEVEVDCSVKSIEDERFSVEIIRKSKLEYIRNYVDSLDEKVLSENGVDREKLFLVLEKYYKTVAGE